MKRFRRLAALLLALALITLSLPRDSGAQAFDGPATEATANVTDADPYSIAGALAAAGCGLFIRVTIATGGTQVGTIAGAVACCLYAALDAAIFDPH